MNDDVKLKEKKLTAAEERKGCFGCLFILAIIVFVVYFIFWSEDVNKIVVSDEEAMIQAQAKIKQCYDGYDKNKRILRRTKNKTFQFKSLNGNLFNYIVKSADFVGGECKNAAREIRYYKSSNNFSNDTSISLEAYANAATFLKSKNEDISRYFSVYVDFEIADGGDWGSFLVQNPDALKVIDDFLVIKTSDMFEISRNFEINKS